MAHPILDHISPLYFCAGLFFVCLLSISSRRRPRYPPGPRGLPIVGNLFDIPKNYGWKRYREFGREYGSDLVHFEVLGTHIVVINSAEVAKDLLEKRSSIYSDKQRSVMIQELTGWHRNFSLLPYGDGWRIRRRLFHQQFRPMAVPHYHPMQVKGVHGLLRSLLDSPEHFRDHLRFMTAKIILNIVYAFDVQPGDHRVELVEKGVKTAMDIIAAGVYLVDVIPILKYLPAWFPGAGFKRQAANWKILVDKMHETPYYEFKKTMQEGNAKPCFAATLLSEVENTEDMKDLEEVFISLTGTAFIAGSDTTVTTLYTFFLAMVMFPETQASAHEELDRVIGRKRLPDIEDRDSLPYISAIVQEVLRWHPILPIGLAHRTIADDEYNGYHIPAGTVVIGNSWAMLRDERLFPDPDLFKPERFLNEDGSLNDGAHYPIETFGFGRRICPGRYFAQDLLWLTVSSVLAAFRIERAADVNGKEIVPKGEFTPRVLSMPEPFECRITPRFPGTESLVRSTSLTD
ncbi:uncharacterized protein PHACADRAFT_209385 [Phanerochaete carnosa HHB-10118-sp]|uniref:Cytochrome P450 n=1 Tax=Phanerochaete carnosa (strain HHB-10118-sp) TaxID=650164 RepID=K5VWF6_PHACS|nr:uncharacterized protein PHACADRAFT_209385 [Phanerochaete carnosa HHB-10118-sp]EKM55873.1 hypothetical protein PHACADRAFT_209385 [Phanerochaete carnosa HHB-10118-sp]